MPKTKKSKKSAVDDSVNKTALYFEKHQQGLTVKEIAEHFNRSVNTVRKYLAEHPKYEPPGRGNRVKAEDRNIYRVKKKVTDVNKHVTFYCPPALLDRFDGLPISGSRTDKLIEAMKLLIKNHDK